MHDDGTSGGPVRQVKVDNWGVFFLQRLQQFFNRSDHCDLTLQFSGNVKIKVHRLVLNACTEYFQALEKKIGRNKDNCLQMPSDLSADVVLPIINFMYTGRLEFRDTLTKKLYYTAGRLNMPVLTKLLDAQGASEMSSEPSVPTVSLTPKPASPSTTSKHSPSVYSPAKKGIGKELPETLPGRKLPIWKKRRTPFLMSSFDDAGPAESAALAPDHATSIKEEPARPTRFEWPEDEDALKSYVPPFDSITYESAPLQPHTTKALSVAEKKTTFEELKSRYQPVKRHAAPVAESTPKKSKIMDIQSVKEYLQEQEVRKQIVSSEEDAEESLGEGGMALGDVDDDDDEDDEREAESILPEDNTEEPQEATSSTPQQTQTKSILKQRYTDENAPGSKKVRFSLAANQEQTFLQSEEFTTDLGEGSSEVQTSPANHAKIISEVLKKYPHLVRDNKNIRLRIMKQGSCQSNESETKNKKVSYVVLKAGDGGRNRTPAKVIVKTGGRIEHISNLVQPSQVTKPVSGAENTTGPWLCFSCGTNDDPVNFETYYLYRRHLQDVHMEKIDARICEHCGHRASKRNLLLYHLYTKHSIPPPRNCQFPKCDQCDYVALSESLLIKHRNNHSNAKDFVCKVCNASFKSNGALQGHMQTNLHSDPDKKKYACPYCHKPFVRNINLKAHIRSAHKDIERKLEDEDQQDEDLVAAAEEAANFDPKKKKRRDILLLRGKDGSHTDGQNLLVNNAQPHSLEPSSEAEALSNVASGIAASLGLADQLAEVHEHQTVVQTMPDADGTVQTFIISAVPGQGEYIVPEMLTTGAGGEQYQIATTSSLGELVHYDASNLSSVVSSLAGVAGQQTIVITTAPSGGQEHLKLISADGSTLDQVTLLTGQNLLVTNPDGTTSTASATEGYQAILQPNGVLTLQPVGTHVLQGEVHDGETISEETLVHQGYVTQSGSIILAPPENVKDMEHAIAMLPQEEVDTKPYTIISTGEHHVEAEVIQMNQENISLESQLTAEQENMATQMSEHQDQLTETSEMTLKPRIIGTSVPIQRQDMKSELVSSTVITTELHQESMGEESQMLSAENNVEMSDPGEEAEQLVTPDMQHGEEMGIEQDAESGQLLITSDDQGEMHEGANMVMAAAAAAAAEEETPVCDNLTDVQIETCEEGEVSMELHEVHIDSGHHEEQVLDTAENQQVIVPMEEENQHTELNMAEVDQNEDLQVEEINQQNGTDIHMEEVAMESQTELQDEQVQDESCSEELLQEVQDEQIMQEENQEVVELETHVLMQDVVEEKVDEFHSSTHLEQSEEEFQSTSLEQSDDLVVHREIGEALSEAEELAEQHVGTVDVKDEEEELLVEESGHGNILLDESDDNKVIQEEGINAEENIMLIENQDVLCDEEHQVVTTEEHVFMIETDKNIEHDTVEDTEQSGATSDMV